MLTETMTDKEKRDEVVKDKESILTHLVKVRERSDYWRAVRKSSVFPFNYRTNYKTPRGNRYRIILTPTDKKRGAENPIFSVFTKMESPEGAYMLRYDIKRDNVTIYTPHFFSRYRERYLKDSSLSSDKVVDIFSERNPNLASESHSHEEEDFCGTCHDGFVLIRGKGKGIAVAVTFVGFDMLRDEQTTTKEELLKVIERHEQKVLLDL